MGLIQSVDKALRLLQALDAHGGWVGVRELARTVGLTPATTHSLLKTLQAKSFVESNAETKQYRLGLAAIRLGEGSDPLNSMREFCRPYIETLANEFDETVIVLTWREERAIAVDWIQADHPLAVTHNHGVIDHPIIFASGRVLLAYQTRATQLRYAARENLRQLAPNSPVTGKEMVALLEQIADDGFAITRNVMNSGIAAVAVPVFDANRQAVLAIGCSAPISRSPDAQIKAVLARLRELAGVMSQKLGGVVSASGQSSAA